MDLLTAMSARHSVRRYLDRPIEPEKAQALAEEVSACNAEGGLHFQLVLEEPEAFRGPLAHYGVFRNVKNYFALVGPPAAQEAVGYYGERLVLFAQTLGLNTCWAALTYRKSKVRAEIAEGEILHLVVALGYGETQGTAHRNKPLESLCSCEGEMPEWFRSGMQAVMTAPTAVNQQKFRFALETGDRVRVKTLRGPWTAIDLGIVKYHFELGAGGHPFTWL